MPGTETATTPPPAPTAILVGNPNVGKSALFGALTGRYATVSNYPGTTVEITRGEAQLAGRQWTIIDTPGTNGLVPVSEDEAVTRDILLRERGVVVQVCDAKNLRRGLVLASQLAEAQVPFVLALNMSDEAKGRGMTIDVPALAEALGVPVVPTVAVERRGLQELSRVVELARPSAFLPTYERSLEAALREAESLLWGDSVGRRALAVMVLSGDETLRRHLAERLPHAALERLEAVRRGAAAGHTDSVRTRLARQRIASVEALLARVLRQDAPADGALRKLDAISTHRVWGWALLLPVLWACYEVVGVFGAQTCVEFLEEKVFAEWIVPPLGAFLRGLPLGELWAGERGLLVGEYGVISMGLSYGLAIVLPIVATFFVMFSLLEDSGYLPRLAVMLNAAFKKMGLNGKAVLPMVLGLGCDTMATMTTRILETRKERVVVTLLLALGVPCSAQLAVIFAMLAGVSGVASIWFAGAIAVVLFLVGWLAAKVIPGRGSDFLLELPPLRVPQASNVAIKTVTRVEWYLREALPLFVLGTVLLWGLDRIGGLAVLERLAAPVVVGLLDLPREAASGFILGFLRRDYAAAGLFAQFQPHLASGTMTREMEIQIVVALVTLTLFVPCIAQFFMMVKERGAKTALAVLAFILPFSFGTGAVVNALMRRFL